MSDPWKDVARAASSSVARIQSGYAAPNRSAWAVRTLAELRHADPDGPASAPGLWELTLGALPDELLGHGAGPATPAEKAVHAAVTLYARHQQSRPEPMHRKGIGLGDAVRLTSARRSSPTEWDPGTLSRFQHMCRASSWHIRVENLRGLIALMRSESVPLDYGILASDLWLLQTSKADNVLLAWGRQLHHITNDNTGHTEGALS